MLDIKLIRQDPDTIKTKLTRRNPKWAPQIDQILAIDEERRRLSSEADLLKSEQNKASKEIPAIKKAGGDAAPILAKMKEIAERVRGLDVRIGELETQQQSILLGIPNTPHASTPDGSDDRDNIEQRRFMEPTRFAFTPKPHWELGSQLQILDPETAAKLTGARFHLYRGAGARLERAVINFYLDTHTANGYTEIFPPYIVNAASMTGTGQLPKFAEDMFKLEGLDYYLIPTAEVPVTNIHRDEILDPSQLPIKYCSYTACFRAEAGSAGRDTRGLIRQHQFNKVELVKFSHPDTSYDELESLTRDAQKVLMALGLPHRVVALCAGDVGASSAKTYDIEVWMPSYDRFVEISSCSNFEDYQARRASIRFRDEKTGKPRLIHTLNGSGVAVGRTVAAIIENYQNEDGSITVPEVLVPYMGMDKITHY